MNKSLIFSITIFLFLHTSAKENIAAESPTNHLEITSAEQNTDYKQDRKILLKQKKQELQQLTNKLVKLQAKLERLKELKKQKKSEGNFIEADQIKEAIKQTAELLRTVSVSIAKVLGHLGGTIGASLTTFVIAFITSWTENFALQKTGYGDPNSFRFPGQNQQVTVNCGGCGIGEQEVLRNGIKQHLMNNQADRAKLSQTLETVAQQNGWSNKIKDHFVNSIINFTTNYVIFYGIKAFLLTVSSKLVP